MLVLGLVSADRVCPVHVPGQPSGSRACRLYRDELGGLKECDQRERSVYPLTATMIDLCLSLLSSVRFRSTKAGVKTHGRLDLRGSPPRVYLDYRG